MHCELIDDENMRISEVCVPERMNNTKMNDWTISFEFDSIEEKRELFDSLTLQSIDKNNINVNLSCEQVGYLRCAIDTNLSLLENLMVDKSSDTDLKIAYLAKMIDVYKHEYDKVLIEKHDIDSSLFSRTSLL